MKKGLVALFVGAIALCSACTMSVPHSAVQGKVSTISKEGRSECKVILGFPTGDCSIATAAKNGGVDEIVIVDQVVHNYIFVVTTETIVYGN